MTTIKQHSPNNKSNKRKKGKNETTNNTTASTTSKEGLQLSAEAESLSGFLSQQFTQARSHNHHLPTASTTAITNTTTAAHSDYKKKYDTIHTTTTPTTPKRVKFFPAEDDFQFTSQQLLEQAISRTELHFHRSTEATRSTTDTTTSTTTPIKNPTTQQRNLGNNLFSPESQRLLDFMDTITFAEVTSQPSICSESRPTSSLHAHKTSNSTATSPRSQRLSRQKPIETKKSVPMKEEYLHDTGCNASRTLSTELSKHTHTSSEVHWQQPQPPLTQQHQQQYRSRVRPNVEYVGRFPISTTTTNTITQSSRLGSNSYASNIPPASPASAVTATNLDEAIEQASLLSIQSILQRRPSDRTMPQDPRLTGTFSSSSSTMSHMSAPYSVGTEWNMQHTHTQVRIGHDTVHYAAPPQQQQLYTNQTSQYHAQPPATQSTVHLPQQLRRSFDPASAAATRVSDRTVQNQNWFSYDEGSRNNTERNNEMWFLFLKQKRDAEEAARSTTKARPRSTDGIRRPTRPYSIDQNRAAAVTEPHYRSPIIRPTPPSVSQKEDWNISLGGLSRETVEGRPRPVSANGRLHTATSTSNHANAPTAVPTRPSLNDALSSALYDTTFSEELCNIPPQLPQQQVFTSSSERVKTKHAYHTKSEKTSHSRTQQQQQRVTGNKNKQHKQEVKERLTSTYIDDKIIF